MSKTAVGRDWLKVFCEWVTGPLFTAASVQARGAWLTMSGYCARYHPGTGGRIPEARSFTSARWSFYGRLKRKTIDYGVEEGLFQWVGDDLFIVNYDLDGEIELEKKRNAGRKGAESRWSGDGTAIGLPLGMPMQSRVEESRGDQTKLEENTPDQSEALVGAVVEFLNKLTGKTFSPGVPETTSLIRQRLVEGRTLDDFEAVIKNRFERWGRDADRREWLRPATLFDREKFDGYLAEARAGVVATTACQVGKVQAELGTWDGGPMNAVLSWPDPTRTGQAARPPVKAMIESIAATQGDYATSSDWTELRRALPFNRADSQDATIKEADSERDGILQNANRQPGG